MNADNFVAWWGAILATLLAAWEVYKHRWERGRVRVDVIPQRDLHEPLNDSVVAHVIVTNASAKAVVLRAVRATLGDHRHTVDVVDGLPRSLAPGEFLTGNVPDSPALPVRDVIAIDVQGRSFRAQPVGLRFLARFREETAGVERLRVESDELARIESRLPKNDRPIE